MWKKLITNVLIPIVAIVSVWINVNQHLTIGHLNKSLEAIDLAHSTPDSLVKEELRSDSTKVFGFDIKNNPAISARILERIVDSLRKNDPVMLAKDAEVLSYSKTRFKSNLAKAKAVVSVDKGDTIATYKDNNWNLSYHYRNTTFDAEYTNTSENMVYNTYERSFLGYGVGSKKLMTDKWFDDKNIVIESSETIIAPTKVDNVDFKLYVSPEYSVTNKSITTGAGADLRFKKIGAGVRYDYNALDKSNRPQHELKINFKYFLINK